MDGRRRRYVPVDVNVAFGNTGTKLIEKLGNEGLLMWLLYLAACKREYDEGVFTYTSEAEGWTKLGAISAAFTLEDFFKVTGRLKATRKRMAGRIVYVACVGWDAMNPDWKAQRRTERDAKSETADAKSETKHTKSDRKVTEKQTPGEPLVTEEIPAPDHVLRNGNGTTLEHDTEAEKEVELESKTEAKLGPIALTSFDSASEKDQEILRLVAECRHRDDDTEAVFRHYGSRLPVAAFAAAREQLKIRRLDKAQAKIRHDGRYCSTLLREMVADGRYSRSAA